MTQLDDMHRSLYLLVFVFKKYSQSKISVCNKYNTSLAVTSIQGKDKGARLRELASTGKDLLQRQQRHTLA